MADYHCAGCGLAVIVFSDHPPIKACTCDAAIIAEASATLHGVGGLRA